MALQKRSPEREFLRPFGIESLRFLLNKILIKTKAAAHAEMILDKAQKESLMVGIIGEEGIGKSSCVAEYVFNTANVFYVKMGPSYRSKGIFHELIFLVTSEFPITTMGMQSSISNLSMMLNNTPGKKLVIADEAGKLRASMLMLFHELRDNTRATTGFVFLGPPYFRENLLEWRSQGKIGIGEFYRRIEYWYSLPYLEQDEKEAYVKARGLELDNELRAIMKECNTIWELETRVNINIEKHKKK